MTNKKKNSGDTRAFDRKLVDLISREIQTINRVLDEHGIDGGVYPRDATISPAYITYGLTLGKGVKTKSVANLRSELSTALFRLRRTKIAVRFDDIPQTIEVPHPHPRPILFAQKEWELPPHTVLLGQSYVEGQSQLEAVPLSEFIHGLVVGMTGSGKSVQMVTTLLALCEYTDPSQLRLHLIDLKNDDLIPLRTLPQVETFAATVQDADHVITQLHTLLEQRIENQETNPHPRHLLVIDEFHLLADNKLIISQLQKLIALGRSMNIHIIAATQHPLEKVVSSLLKANFPNRLVGMVTSKEASKVASSRAGVGAELLPGKGSFLRVGEGKITRYQTFFIDKPDIPDYVRHIAQLYPDWQPVETIPGQRSVAESPPSPKMSRIITLARKQHAQETFNTYFDPETGKFKYGGKTKMVAALFGKHALRGGDNWYTTDQVIEYLIDQQKQK